MFNFFLIFFLFFSSFFHSEELKLDKLQISCGDGHGSFFCAFLWISVYNGNATTFLLSSAVTGFSISDKDIVKTSTKKISLSRH